MAKTTKYSIALAALLTILLLAGRLYPVNFFDGLFVPSQMLVTCGTLNYNDGLKNVLEWTALSLVAIMVALIWAIIGQVLGGAFGGQKYNEFIKGMVWGAVETAALLGLFMSLFIFIWPYGTENLDKARAYASLTRNTVSFDFGLMLMANMVTGFVTNLNTSFKVPGAVFITVGFQIAPMFKPLMDILGVAMQLITTSVLRWSAQEFLICFIKSHMLAILLPAGFFLRGFGLKAGGNALIGIALSMYFVYPYMITMVGQAVSDHVANELAFNSGGTTHPWAGCLDKPICCVIPGGAKPGSLDDNFIPNGKNWQSNTTDRISVEQINQGVFDMKYDNQADSGSTTNNWCMYNTMFANAYKGFFVDKIMKGGAWSFAGGAAGMTTIAILKYMNISWLVTFLVVPLSYFTFYVMSDIMYFVFIVTIIAPIFILFVTLTLAKEIAKALGTEIDLSSLEKLI